MKQIKIAMLSLLMAASVMPLRAQDDPDYECKVKYQLFKNYQKDGNLEDAYNMLTYCLENCPKVGKNLYIQGANMIKSRIAAAQTAEERQRYINELMHLYDVRKAAYNEPDVMARKAKEMQDLLGKAGVSQYYPLYAQAVAEQGDKLEASWVYLYFVATVDYVVGGNADSSMVVDNYDIASELLDKELTEVLTSMLANKEKGDKAAADKDSAAAALIRAQIALVENSFSPFADCEQLVQIYSRKFQNDPENVDLLKKITKIMRKKDCTKSDLFFAAAEKLYSLEPTPSSAMMMAQMCYTKERFADAVKYYRDALPGLTEQKDIYTCNLFLGRSLAEQRSWSAARSAFYEAAKADPTKGEPYLQIAQLYANSASSIPDGMKGHSAYWAACDKANKAKSIDPDLAESAQRLINAYAGRFPNQETAFMLNIKDGTSFVVPGWIGESTIVRTRK